MFARAPSSFGFDPGSRSHLKQAQFRDAPDVIGQSCCHGWCAFIPEMLAITQLLMRPTEMVGTSDQIHSRLQGLQTLGSMPAFACQRSQTFPHGGIEPLNKGGIEHTSPTRALEQRLCLIEQGELLTNPVKDIAIPRMAARPPRILSSKQHFALKNVVERARRTANSTS